MDERTWGIVEVLGHGQWAGLLSEGEGLFTGMLRVDIPPVRGLPAFTRYLGRTSLFAVTPTTEEMALAAAQSFRSEPPMKWQIERQLPEPQSDDNEPDYDDDVD